VRPGDFDDLLAAVFGIHGAQIIKEMQMFRGWTDLSIPLPGLLAGFAIAYARNQLSGYVGDEAGRLAEARARIHDFLDRWGELTDQLCSFLWAELRRNHGRPDAEFAMTLGSLAGSNDAEIQQRIEEYLRHPAAFDTNRRALAGIGR